MDKGLFLHFISDSPFVLNINGEYAATVDNETVFSCDLFCTAKKLMFSYFPASEKDNLIPYTNTLILKEKEVQSEHENIEIINCGEGHFDILLKPIKYKSAKGSEIFFEELIDKISIIILNDSDSNIYVYDNGKIKIHKIVPIITQAEVENINNKLIIKCALHSGGFYVLILDKENLDIITDKICDSFEMENDTFKMLVKQNDFSKHAVVSEINLNNSHVEDYAIYLDAKPKIIDEPMLVPLAFLQAVKVKNFKLAKIYLSKEYDNVSDAHLSEYFGNIEHVHFNRHLSNKKKVCYIVKSKEYKNYEFVIIDKKINEIIN